MAKCGGVEGPAGAQLKEEDDDDNDDNEDVGLNR